MLAVAVTYHNEISLQTFNERYRDRACFCFRRTTRTLLSLMSTFVGNFLQTIIAYPFLRLKIER